MNINLVMTKLDDEVLFVPAYFSLMTDWTRTKQWALIPDFDLYKATMKCILVAKGIEYISGQIIKNLAESFIVKSSHNFLVNVLSELLRSVEQSDWVPADIRNIKIFATNITDV